MACELTLWNSQTGEKKTVVCDEENSAKMIEDEHAKSGTGEYTDLDGNKVSVDWSAWRLVKFARKAEQ